MSGDTLSDLLRAVRLRGAVFYHIEADERWVAEAPPAREIIAAIMPGAGHMIEFHGIVRGSCWAAVLGEPPVRLEAGDVVLFPQGEAHTLSSAPGMRAGQMDRSLFFTPRPLQLPFGLRVDDAGVVTPRREEAASGGTTVVCGFLGFDARPFNPLLARCRGCCTCPAPPWGTPRGSRASCARPPTSRAGAAPGARRCSSG